MGRGKCFFLEGDEQQAAESVESISGKSCCGKAAEVAPRIILPAYPSLIYFRHSSPRLLTGLCDKNSSELYFYDFPLRNKLLRSSGILFLLFELDTRCPNVAEERN